MFCKDNFQLLKNKKFFDNDHRKLCTTTLNSADES